LAKEGDADVPDDTGQPSIVFSESLISETTYTVQSGDTLRAIAERFGSSIEAIAERNNISDPDLIFEGQILQIPIGGG